MSHPLPLPAAIQKESTTRPSCLLRDERGAVMVLGIFMCATLVGALWYIAGIGDAIVFRERLQEAADAAALSDAVLHARGMNLIVFINLIMACVLAIRVALKVIQVALIFAAVVFYGISLIPFNVTAPFWAGLATLCEEGAETVQQIIERTRDPINNMLKGLHKAEWGIARVVPGASSVGSLQVVDKYKPFITSGFSAPMPEKLLDGLPVVDGTTDRLCGKAGEAMIDIVDYVMPIDLGSGMSILKGIMATIVEKGAGYFCELGGAGGPPDLSAMTEKTASDRCGAERKKKQQELDDRSKDWHAECSADKVTCLDEVPVDPFNPDSTETKSDMQGLEALQKSTKPEDKAALGRLADLQKKRDAADDDLKGFSDSQCVEKEKKVMNDKLKALPPSAGGNGNGMEPMKVDPKWFNGIKDAQVLSYVRGDDSSLRRGPKGVRVGAMKNKHVPARIDTPLGADFGYAQAEFFYDCSGTWGSTQCNAGDSPYNDDEEAMWHLRWRARLRRYNGPFNAVDLLLDALVVDRAAEMEVAAFKNATTDPFNAARRLELMSVKSLDSFKVH